MQTLRPGSTLYHGSYRIERVLGQGGFGITYLATDINLGRQVAVKEFFPKDYCEREGDTSHVTLGTQNTAEMVMRMKTKFLKEARNIAKFDHPGIITIYAAFEENNTAYYVMEYIEGEPLSAIVRRSGPLPLGLAWKYIREVGEALEYVHARRINHLDVKPANIMVRRSDNSAILIDFGLSKQYDSEGKQTSTTPTGLSHGFAPLEQYKSGGLKEFSPQTDLYSLAATLYYLLTGEVPPQAPQLADEDLVFQSTIPYRLTLPIATAMSSGRKKRQPTVAQFLDELQQAGETDSGKTGSQTQKTRTESPTVIVEDSVIEDHTRKKRTVLMITIAAVVLVLGAAIFLLLNKSQGETYEGSEVNEEPPAELVVKVTDMDWQSPLGAAVYSGEIVNDTLANGEIVKIPDGKGVARITGGKYAGNVYDGTFVKGELEGPATYTLANKDVFTGTFHRNQFEEGKYLDAECGEYFVGTFRDMQPYKGKWYSSTGEVVEEV